MKVSSELWFWVMASCVVLNLITFAINASTQSISGMTLSAVAGGWCFAVALIYYHKMKREKS